MGLAIRHRQICASKAVNQTATGGTEPGNMTNTYGAIISIVASILSNIGTNVQKEAHLRNEAKPEEEQTPYIKSPLWWLGLVGVVVGSIGDFVAFSLASQELVVAVGC